MVRLEHRADASDVCAKEYDTDSMFYAGETSSNKSTMRSEVVSSCSDSIKNAQCINLYIQYAVLVEATRLLLSYQREV